ncbi:Fpg/Nei family DNA glycosylase [soil metagenome]
MPEGDTIWRAAHALDLALSGQVVTAFRSRAPAIRPAAERALAGSSVREVRSRGKHLLMRFSAASDELVLHTHMRMHGSWHLYRPGERWRRSPSAARVVVETAAYVAPCFDAPVVEVLRARDLARHPALAELGPDAIAEEFHAVEARLRLRARPEREIGVALLDQRSMAGLGNVYKSEVLFVRRLSPFTPVGQLGDDELDALIAEGRRLLLANRQGPVRRTRNALDPRQPLWIYGRAGQGCWACGQAVRAARQGEDARVTYFCATCQPRRKAPP